MKKPLNQRLMEKGWSEEEANRTHKLFYDHPNPQKHVHYVKKSSVLFYWMMLLDLAICNFIVSFGLVPFLMVLKPGYVELIVVVLGVFMGLFFNMLIWDIEHIERKHHYMAMIFIPVTAIINMVIMVVLANKFAVLLKAPGHANAFVISLFYVLAFSAPYGFSVAKYEIQSRRKKGKTPEQMPPGYRQRYAQ